MKRIATGFHIREILDGIQLDACLLLNGLMIHCNEGEMVAFHYFSITKLTVPTRVEDDFNLTTCPPLSILYFAF